MNHFKNFHSISFKRIEIFVFLFKVPCTLGVTYYYAYKRGQFQILWTDQISEIHAYELTEKNELIDVSDENEEGL
jgi:hypothetical protein